MLERVVIDSLWFAQARESLGLEVSLAELPRVSTMLRRTDGAVEISLRGIMVARGQLGLELELAASLPMACQRCLGEILFPLRHQRRFCLADNVPDNVADEDAEVDCISASRELDVLHLVEEEILLCLPLAPTHEDKDCAAAVDSLRTRQELSPFAGLNRRHQ